LSPALASALAGGLALLLTPALAAWARARGWIDRVEGGDAVRKPRSEPVPTVGGVAVVTAMAAAALLSGLSLPWMGLLGALGLGVLDDLRPLGARQKLSGQALVALGLATDGYLQGWGTGSEWLLLIPIALVAMNALNTWDHADGLASTTALLGLAGPLPMGAAACAGFLPWNTLLRRGSDRGRAPVAYLGDGGSHALGALVAWYPSAWPVLAVPLLDLARVVWLRLAAGQSAFVGDRRHFGQRLERAGLGPVPAAGVAALCLLPASSLWISSSAMLRGALLGTSLGLYAWALIAARGGRDPADACDGP
jgi:UDP-N-acetylmuramyl pentapeptide phosphotransferase/UDP-N-acetylglucosamine-1-phosphate transferase